MAGYAVLLRIKIQFFSVQFLDFVCTVLGGTANKQYRCKYWLWCDSHTTSHIPQIMALTWQQTITVVQGGFVAWWLSTWLCKQNASGLNEPRHTGKEEKGPCLFSVYSTGSRWSSGMIQYNNSTFLCSLPTQDDKRINYILLHKLLIE